MDVKLRNACLLHAGLSLTFPVQSGFASFAVFNGGLEVCADFCFRLPFTPLIREAKGLHFASG